MDNLLTFLVFMSVIGGTFSVIALIVEYSDVISNAKRDVKDALARRKRNIRRKRNTSPRKVR